MKDGKYETLHKIVIYIAHYSATCNSLKNTNFFHFAWMFFTPFVKRISCSQIGFRKKKHGINISFWNVLYPFELQEWVSRDFKDSKQRVQEEEKLPRDTWLWYEKYTTLQKIHDTTNILMPSTFENAQNKQHKHSHATSIGEYILLLAKMLPLCLLLSLTVPVVTLFPPFTA
jgi:hypothetical protein